MRVALWCDFCGDEAIDGLAALLPTLAPTNDNPIHVDLSVLGEREWFDACAAVLDSTTGGAFTVRFEIPAGWESAG